MPKTSFLNLATLINKQYNGNTFITDSIGLDEPEFFFNVSTKNSNLSNKIQNSYKLTNKFEFDHLKNFVENKDLSLRDEIYLSINLLIGISMILIILWMTVAFCIRNYKRRKYDQIELLSINSYYD